MMRILTTLILILSLSLSLSRHENKILFHAFISISAMQSGQNHLGEFEKAPAPASLNDRIGQCEAALSLRTKPLRKMSSDHVNSMVLSLSQYWSILPYDSKSKLADAQSGRLLSDLALNDVAKKHIVKRREVFQGYFGMGSDF